MATRDEKCVLIAFGSNLAIGEMRPAQIISTSAAQICELGGTLEKMSQLYKTPCFPADAGPDYVNAAAKLTWRKGMTAGQILAVLHKVEAEFGRERLQRWGTRTLDIDLIAVDDSVVPDATTQDYWRNLPLRDQMLRAPDQLILPHPRLADRAFVLVPLLDVAPNWRHPRTGRTVRQMLTALPKPDIAAVTPL